MKLNETASISPDGGERTPRDRGADLARSQRRVPEPGWSAAATPAAIVSRPWMRSTSSTRSASGSMIGASLGGLLGAGRAPGSRPGRARSAPRCRCARTEPTTVTASSVRRSTAETEPFERGGRVIGGRDRHDRQGRPDGRSGGSRCAANAARRRPRRWCWPHRRRTTGSCAWPPRAHPAGAPGRCRARTVAGRRTRWRGGGR